MHPRRFEPCDRTYRRIRSSCPILMIASTALCATANADRTTRALTLTCQFASEPVAANSEDQISGTWSVPSNRNNAEIDAAATILSTFSGSIMRWPLIVCRLLPQFLREVAALRLLSVDRLTVPLQPRRLMIAASAAGCKWVVRHQGWKYREVTLANRCESARKP